MKKLTVDEFEKKLASIPEEEPDEWDLQMLETIEKETDKSRVSLEEMDALRATQDYSGKISIRVPKTLHRDLTRAAKQEGISLNQFILYKLAK